MFSLIYAAIMVVKLKKGRVLAVVVIILVAAGAYLFLDFNQPSYFPSQKCGL